MCKVYLGDAGVQENYGLMLRLAGSYRTPVCFRVPIISRKKIKRQEGHVMHRQVPGGTGDLASSDK